MSNRRKQDKHKRPHRSKHGRKAAAIDSRARLTTESHRGHGVLTQEAARASDSETAFLEEQLTPEGKELFEKLCQDCNRNYLGIHLILLVTPSKLRLESGHEIELRHMDVQDPLAPVGPDGLKQVVDRARRLIEDVERLKRTLLVRHLRAQRAFQPRDLLDGSPVCDLIPPAFHGLLDLPRLAKEVSRGTPERDRLLTKIYEHIHSRTREWRDELIADVLQALDPSHRNHPWNAEMLKQWRFRKGLKDKGKIPKTFPTLPLRA